MGERDERADFHNTCRRWGATPVSSKLSTHASLIWGDTEAVNIDIARLHLPMRRQGTEGGLARMPTSDADLRPFFSRRHLRRRVCCAQ